jgi:hypothetical protein
MRSGGRWQPNSCAAWCSHTRSPSEEDDSCESAAAMMIFVGTKEKRSARQSGSASRHAPRASVCFQENPKVGESDVFTDGAFRAKSFRRFRRSERALGAHRGRVRGVVHRGHEHDVRVLVEQVLRAVAARAHRAGGVVHQHGDAASARHRF